MGAAAVAVMIRREKDIVRVFQSAGAVSSSTARPLGALGLEESRHFALLERAGVIRKGAPGTWYLDQAGWNERVLRRRRIGVMLLVVSLLALAFGLGLLPTSPR
jgi:hypothetical protein